MAHVTDNSIFRSSNPLDSNSQIWRRISSGVTISPRHLDWHLHEIRMPESKAVEKPTQRKQVFFEMRIPPAEIPRRAIFPIAMAGKTFRGAVEGSVIPTAAYSLDMTYRTRRSSSAHDAR
jgi:hypothetical protein